MIEPGGVPTTVICDRTQWPGGPQFACSRGMMILIGQHALDSPAMVAALIHDGWVERSGRWYCDPICADIGERFRADWHAQWERLRQPKESS